MQEQTHHFFCSNSYCWATASTRQEAIRKVASMTGNKFLRKIVEENGGAAFTSCKVNHPYFTEYSIVGFVPDRLDNGDKVNVSDVVRGMMLNTKGHFIAAD